MPTSLIVHLDIHPERFDEFVALARVHAARSVEQEPDCLDFQLYLPREQPHRVILVETYRDDAALETHLGSAYMADYLERTGPMVATRQRAVCDN